MQRASFPFEVIVGEDCSTDRTRAIVLAYARAHAGRLRVLTSETNVGPVANLQRVLRACRGKYHALCEGDDYWVDPLKLAGQVQYLEEHADCPLCFHNAFLLREEPGGARLLWNTPPPARVSAADLLAMEPTPALASVMVRAGVYDALPEWRYNVWCPDWVLLLWCAHQGGLGYLDRPMSVYRSHRGGQTGAMARCPERWLADNLHVLAELEKETGDRYAASIAARRCRVAEAFTAARLGRWRYLRRPWAAVRRLNEIRLAVQAYRHAP